MSWRAVTAIPKLSPRAADGHKGLYGSVLLVGGSRGMAGAAALSGAAALRSGAGKVRVACAQEVQATVASFEPCYMTYPLANDDEGVIKFESARRSLSKLLSEADVLAAGPGLGRSEDLDALAAWLVEEATLPTVLDADALNALAGRPEVWKNLTRPVVITPHPGEFARLTGLSTSEIQRDRAGCAAAFAAAHPHLVVVLKGAGTIVTDGERVFTNTTGNPGMATGGAGDVLTGVVAALIGQKLDAFDAAVLATYIHGLAGDVARENSGEVGMIAGDIVDALADAFYHWQA